MKAKEYLDQPRKLNYEIKSIESLLFTLRSRAESITASTDKEAVSSSSITDKPCDFVEKKEPLDIQLTKAVHEWRNKIAEVYEVIAKVTNSTYRTLLTEYYLNGRTWSRVAEIMNYSEETIYDKREQAIQEVEKLIQ